MTELVAARDIQPGDIICEPPGSHRVVYTNVVAAGPNGTARLIQFSNGTLESFPSARMVHVYRGDGD